MKSARKAGKKRITYIAFFVGMVVATTVGAAIAEYLLRFSPAGTGEPLLIASLFLGGFSLI